MDVIKDALDVSYHTELRRLLTNNSFPWYFTSSSAYGVLENKDHFSFAHILCKNGVPCSEYYKNFEQGILSLLTQFYIPLPRLTRARLGLITRSEDYINHNPHIDTTRPHGVILYYLTDSDAPTYLYNTKFTPSEEDSYDKGVEQSRSITYNDVKIKVIPEANKAIMFNGAHYHSSSKPVKYPYRIVLNINFWL
jgi:hypothetical protein